MWQANREYLEYLVKLLTAASTVNDTSQQREIAKSMEDYCTLPESDLYLLVVLTSPPDTGVNETIRSMAGLILKNNLRRRSTLSLETIAFMQHCNLLSLLHDRTLLVRSTLGTLLASVAMRLGRQLSVVWPDLLSTLAEAAGNGGVASVAAAEALAKICEDAADELAEDLGSVGRFVPLMLELLKRDDTEEGTKVGVLKALNCFILQDDTIEGQNLSNFLTILSHRATVDSGVSIRRIICQSLNLLLEGHSDEMRPALPSILEYMLKSVQRTANEESVALEACEFWLSLSERDSAMEFLVPMLSRLLPILMENIVYSDDDPELEANNEEATVPDRLEDIKPRHHNAAVHGGGEEGELQEDDDDEEGDDDDDEIYGEWTLRKCSAATIDILSTTIEESHFLPVLLPLINHNLNSKSWKIQESGILALGAISEGCIDSMATHLGRVVPFVMQSLASPVPIVRSISAWTLSRYATLINDPQVVIAVVKAMGDTNKRVQHASCTAVSVFAEKKPFLVSSLMKFVMEVSAHSLVNYQTRNLTVLYDTLGSIADCCEENLNEFTVVLPYLMQRWVGMHDDDSALYPLLECVCSIAVAAGSLMAPYAAAILQRSSAMIERILKAAVLSTSPDAEVDFDFCIVALDVIGGLVQGLGPSMLPLLQQMTPKLETVLQRCCNEPRPQVRQSSFALIGDLAEKCPMALVEETLFPWLITSIAANVDVMQEDATHGSANNAVWALGELARSAKLGRSPELAPHLSALLEGLCHYLSYSNVHNSYLENVAVCIGRCLAVIPPPNILGSILPKWAQMISMVTDMEECRSAWMPMISILLQKPELLTNNAVNALLLAISRTKNNSSQLEEAFRSLVMFLRSSIGAGWAEYRARQLSSIPLDFDSRFNLLQQ